MPYKNEDAQSKYKAENYQKNKKRYCDNLRDRRQKRAVWFVALKSEMKCEICGESHPACIDFHHKDKDEKFMEVSDMVGAAYSESRILQEIEKCNIWCSNCHRKYHWNEYKMPG
jgi:hypothetical protein